MSRSLSSRLLLSSWLPLLALAATLFPGSAEAEPFGRFGYEERPQVPGWVFDGVGFRPDAPGAERIAFDEGLPPLKLEAIDERRAIFRSGELVYTPRRVRFDLTDVGPLLQCPQGLALKIPSTQAPYLSWKEGSVGPGVPTPNVRWLAVSFRNDAPPIVLGISGSAAGFRLDGAPGAWTLRSIGKVDLGWVRLGLPMGRATFATNSAAQLGKLSLLIDATSRMWTAPPAELRGYELSADADGVTATWRFDRPGVVVPSGLYLAHGGGYGLQFLSPIERTGLPLPVGRDEAAQRIVVTQSNELSIRFPCRLVPRARAVPVGSMGAMPPEPKVETPITTNPSVVAPYALSLLLGEREAGAPGRAEALASAYFEAATTSEEPVTRQRLLGDPAGGGLDEAASFALLARCRTAAAGGDDPDPLFTSLVWRRDWRTERFVRIDSAVARRASALAALAGALSSDASRRLEGALFEAGLSAERTEATLLALERGKPTPRFPEPFGDLRRSIFAYPLVRKLDPFFLALRSPVRVIGAPAIGRDEDGLVCEVSDAGTLAFRLFGVPGSLPGPGAQADGSLGFSVTIAGRTTWRLALPKVPSPPAAPVPAWDETPR